MAILGGLIILFLICCGLFPAIEITIGLIIIIFGLLPALGGIYLLIDGDIGSGLLLLVIGAIIILIGVMFL